MPLYKGNGEVDIINAALGLIEREPISDPADTMDAAANTARLFYPRVRDRLQRRYFWNFNKARASLPAHADAPAFEYERKFELPPDCLRVRNVYGHDDEEWEVEADRFVFINAEAPLKITYSKRVTDPAKFDDGFIALLEHELALVLAPAHARDKSLTEQLKRDTRRVRNDARVPDAQEARRHVPVQSAFLDARRVP